MRELHVKSVSDCELEARISQTTRVACHCCGDERAVHRLSVGWPEEASKFELQTPSCKSRDWFSIY